MDPALLRSKPAAELYLAKPPPTHSLVLYLAAPPNDAWGCVPRGERLAKFDKRATYEPRKLKPKQRANFDAAIAAARALKERARAERLPAALRDASLDAARPAPRGPRRARLPLVGRLLRLPGDRELRVVDVEGGVVRCGAGGDAEFLPLAAAYEGLRAHAAWEEARELAGRGQRLNFVSKIKPCGECKHCLDSPTFGGPGTSKQACVLRQADKLRLSEGLDHLAGFSPAHIAANRKRARLLIQAAEHPPAEPPRAAAAAPAPSPVAAPAPKPTPRPPQECSVCWAQFDFAEMVPSSDQCEHVMCRACLVAWRDTCSQKDHNTTLRSGVRISCPLCRKPSRVAESESEPDA
jgi:hypothetical protein